MRQKLQVSCRFSRMKSPYFTNGSLVGSSLNEIPHGLCPTSSDFGLAISFCMHTEFLICWLLAINIIHDIQENRLVSST